MNKMKILSLILGLFMMASCKGQTDLGNLKYGERLLSTDDLEKDYSVYVPLDGIYRVKNIDQFKYSNIPLTSDSVEFKNETMIHRNSLDIIVDSYDNNQFWGFELQLVNEKVSDRFLDLLMKKYGTPSKQYEYVKKQNKDFHYLWQSKPSNEIIYFNKHNEDVHTSMQGKRNAVLSETRIIILKDGLAVKPNKNDPRNTQEKIDTILKSNPKAFDLLEIFKNQIPE
ncbi:hypothetical protein QEG73_23070 [Chitinophagaceae bacterium 26-R-25]|nr:hypothetical protein [Chitinophagaceae bacterium 26-R-25]